jgi:hypothetical protein
VAKGLLLIIGLRESAEGGETQGFIGVGVSFGAFVVVRID